MMNMIIEYPYMTAFFLDRLGRSNINIPPVFSVASLLYTSAYNVFSISMPATLLIGFTVAYNDMLRLSYINTGI